MTTIRFETEPCDRCGGTGDYPSPLYSGLCLKCCAQGTSHKGQMLTPAGRRAQAKLTKFIESLPTQLMSTAKAGDKVKYPNTKWMTLTADPVLLDDGSVRYTTRGQGPVTAHGDWPVHIYPGFDAIRALLTKRDGSPIAGVIIN